MTFRSLNYIDTNNNFLIISPLDINRLTPVMLHDIAISCNSSHLSYIRMYEVFQLLYVIFNAMQIGIYVYKSCKAKNEVRRIERLGEKIPRCT